MLKNKHTLRKLALALCLSLIVGLFPVGMMNMPVTANAVPAQSENLVQNGDFEASDAEIAGWSIYGSSPVSIATGEGRNGSNALYLDDRNTGYPLEINSERISVDGGAEYRFSAWNKMNGEFTSSHSYAEVYLFWYDASGYVGDNSFRMQVGADWTETVRSFTAPVNAVAVYLRVYISKVATVSVYMDDVSLTKIGADPAPTETTEATQATQATQSTEATEATVVFQDFISGTASPDAGAEQWKESNGGEETVLTQETGIARVFRSGNALIFQGGAKNVQYYAKSPAFAVAGGKTYTAAYETQWHFRNSTKGTVEIVFLDAQGNVLNIKSGDAYDGTAQSATWATTTFSAAAPAGAVNAYIKFGYRVTEGSYDYWLRNLVVTENETEASETNSLLVNGGFEDGTDHWSNTSVITPYTEDKHSGNAAAKFVDDTMASGSYTMQKVAVVPGKTYQLSAWVKVVASSHNIAGYIGIYNVGAACAQTTFSNNGQWAQYSLTVTIPAGYTLAHIEIGVSSGRTSTFLVDDVDFVEVTAEEPAPTQSTEATEETQETQETQATEPRDPNLMIDEKFERFVNAKDANSGPFGWSSSDDSAGTYSLAITCAQLPDIRQDGCYLLLQKVGNWNIRSASFAVKPGYEYTADFLARKMVDNEDFKGYLEICFVDMFGLLLHSEREIVGKTYGAWSAESVKAVAPEGAVEAYLVFGLDNNGRNVRGDYGVDDLVVMQSTEAVIDYGDAPVISTEPVYKDSFEDFSTPEGSPNSVRVPNGWTPSRFGAALSSGKYTSYDGTYNLCLQDKDDKWIKSPLFDAEEGSVYTAVFMEKKLYPGLVSGGAYVKIVFTDGAEKTLSQVTKEIGQATKWTLNAIQAQAPAGAKQFYVEFGIAGAVSDPSFAVDDLQIIKSNAVTTAPEQPAPDTPQPDVPQPDDTEDNAPTGDYATPVFMVAMLVMALSGAVAVLHKRRSF